MRKFFLGEKRGELMNSTPDLRDSFGQKGEGEAG
jgi:hypothetical protein